MQKWICITDSTSWTHPLHKSLHWPLSFRIYAHIRIHLITEKFKANLLTFQFEQTLQLIKTTNINVKYLLEGLAKRKVKQLIVYYDDIKQSCLKRDGSWAQYINESQHTLEDDNSGYSGINAISVDGLTGVLPTVVQGCVRDVENCGAILISLQGNILCRFDWHVINMPFDRWFGVPSGLCDQPEDMVNIIIINSSYINAFCHSYCILSYFIHVRGALAYGYKEN